MTALLYRGHSYEAPAASPKACVELTYRREHYNTCREAVAHNAHPTLTYRGQKYDQQKVAGASAKPALTYRGVSYAK